MTGTPRIDLGFLKSKRLAVLGLGRTGMSAARALLAAQAEVLAWDDSPAQRARAAAEGVPVVDPSGVAFDDVAMLVLSPGVPRTFPAPHPAVIRALEAGCPIRGDLDLLGLSQPEAGYIGITGTNGKSTTTALVGHLLREGGVTAEVGGNLGTPALDLAPLGPEGWYVLEVSSFQLETVSTIGWRIGVFLNITPDHLDRYADMAAYVAAKRRLFDRQPAGASAVVGIDDDWSRRVLEHLRARGDRRLVPVAVGRPASGGVAVLDGRLIDDLDGAARPILELAGCAALPGDHNAQNAAAAYAVARLAGLDAAVIAGAMRDFPGLAHRQQPVAERDGIRFVNDSKATNPDAAARALATYQRIYWIAGGRAKKGGLEALAPWLDRIACAFLIGEATELLAGFLDGRVPVERCGDLDRAVRAAAARARADGATGAVVLLSPACASFDQFTSFEARGDAFIETVRALMAAPAGTSL